MGKLPRCESGDFAVQQLKNTSSFNAPRQLLLARLSTVPSQETVLAVAVSMFHRRPQEETFPEHFNMNLGDDVKKILIFSVLMALTAFASAHALMRFPEQLECGSEAEVWIASGHGGTTRASYRFSCAKLGSPDGKKSIWRSCRINPGF